MAYRTALLLLPLLLAGCGDGPPLVPVRGTVVYRQQPVKGATVLFIADATRGTRAPGALAQTGADGSFTLQSPPFGPGAVAGHYRAIILRGDDAGTPVPAKYSLAHLTPLKVEVPADGQENVPLVLQD